MTETIPGLHQASSSTAGSAAAVSEPGSYALLVGGLGLMGFVARRRTKAKGA